MGVSITLEEAQDLRSGQQKHNAYNCIDCIATRRVADKLIPLIAENPNVQRVYDFERALQNPYMAMMRRGILIDVIYRDQLLKKLEADIEAALLAAANDDNVLKVWDGTELEKGSCKRASRKDGKHKWESWEKGKPEHGRTCTDCGVSRLSRTSFNANSATQTSHLLYKLLKIKEQRNKKGEVSADEEVLERIGRLYPKYEELTKKILLVRDLKKQYGFAKSKLTPDNRWMQSANVGTAWSGRSSSSKNPMGYGNNAQNVAERFRRLFIPDPGFEMFYADLKQAESMAVAYLAEDEAYIEAHLLGDVHTYVARAIWPDELPWTGDLKEDKKLASSTNPPWDQAPGHNYRFQAKRNCFTSATELLTPKGWKPVTEIKDREEICVWNTEGNLAWEVPSSWFRGETDEMLLRLSGRNMQQTVTSDHRLPHFNNGKWGERQACDMPLNYGRYPVSGCGEWGLWNLHAKIRAAVWCDGSHKNGGRTRQTVFSFRKARKILRLRELLSSLGLEWREREDPGPNVTFIVEGKLQKNLDWSMILWDYASREAFLDEVVHWDGDQDRRIFNTDLEGLRIIQTMAHITGMRASIVPHGTPRENEKQCWVLHLRRSTRGDWSNIKVEAVDHKGPIACPSTSTGWVLVRENGHISVSGQTHGKAYGISPLGTARIVHISEELAKKAHERMDKAFPNIKLIYQGRVRARVEAQLPIVTSVGREILLFDRPKDGGTHRQGYSAEPQSLVADLVNIALYFIWHKYDPDLIQILANGYDAILGQSRIGHREEAIKAIKEAMSIPVTINGRVMVIPVEISYGMNWGKRSEDNPLGQEEI